MLGITVHEVFRNEYKVAKRSQLRIAQRNDCDIEIIRRIEASNGQRDQRKAGAAEEEQLFVEATKDMFRCDNKMAIEQAHQHARPGTIRAFWILIVRNEER